MENLNHINFNIQNIAQQKANIVQSSQQQSLPQQQTQQNAPIIQQQAQNINPSLMYDLQLAKMDNETVLKYLQSLLKLPNSIDKFVNMLNSKNIDPKIASILIENMVNVKALSEFLNKNSSEAISKLMQTISQSLKSGVNDVAQLKEIMSILGVIQSSTNLNSNTIKELLLLYIPLNQPVFDKEIEGNNFNEEENKAIKNSKLSILLETINFSNVLCAINEEEGKIFIDIFTAKNFPNSHFSTIINTLAKEINVVPLIDFKNIKENTDKKEQNFKIISESYISSNLLILSHIIIKTIFKIDNDFIEEI